MISVSSGSPLEHLEACLFPSQAERPAYGYELKRSLAELDLDVPDLDASSRTLRSMEERCLVGPCWARAAAGLPVAPTT